MSQDVNPNPSRGSYLVILMYWACKREGSIFLVLDQKARAASVQSFPLWQQTKIEIIQRDHSVFACSRHIYLCVVLCAQPVCGESHFQCNINRQVATTFPPYCNAVHRSHVPFVRVAPGTTFTYWSKQKAPVCCDWKA